MIRRSLRLRLLLLLLVFFALAWSGVGVLTFREARHEVGEVYDAHLEETARILMGIALHELEERDKEPAADPPPDNTTTGNQDNGDDVADLEQLLLGHKYATDLSFRMWEKGELMLRSSVAPPRAERLVGGFSERSDSGHRWRVFTLVKADRKVAVEVGERIGARDEVVEEISQQVLYPMAVGLPALALLIWLGVGRGLAPLGRLTGEVARRAPGQLQPVAVDSRVPNEVAPLVRAINGLLSRLAATLERERRFTSDASHELRTPLASIKTQTQVALRAGDEEERRRALQQIRAGVDRATHLVEQLLTIARLEPEVTLSEGQPVALRGLAAEVIATCIHPALDKRIDLGLADGAERTVSGSPGALGILLRNLIDNAVRYTPEGGQVEVAVTAAGDKVRLQVADSGPGVPAQERERIFDRFYRGSDVKASGCGLGLSIVQRIAALHRAEIRLEDSPLGGLSVEVLFPAAS